MRRSKQEASGRRSLARLAKHLLYAFRLFLWPHTGRAHRYQQSADTTVALAKRGHHQSSQSSCCKGNVSGQITPPLTRTVPITRWRWCWEGAGEAASGWGKCPLKGVLQSAHCIIRTPRGTKRGFPKSRRWNEPLNAALMDGAPKPNAASRSLVSVTGWGIEVPTVLVDGGHLMVRLFNGEGRRVRAHSFALRPSGARRYRRTQWPRVAIADGAARGQRAL